jgi:hypothetical protein
MRAPFVCAALSIREPEHGGIVAADNLGASRSSKLLARK